MDEKLLFALDIGTRSVVGLVGERTPSGIELAASYRQEHRSRAMLDGQIHDVLEVANVLREVKERLEKKTGPLKKVAVAAAGRALHTIRASSEIDSSLRGVLTAEVERSLELAAIQAAQLKLANSTNIANPATYYCVGYSVISFSLDGTQLKSLIGQRGRTATIDVIATFLPRQVIDSLQSALETAGLDMDTLTLEPIAAINVLIPPTMRHLNLALVDVGAGTSDVAITRGGSVIGYGMVPYAGDEITEAISQKYILDFNVAEAVKRQLGGKNKKIAFDDVLGMSHKVATGEILETIGSNVAELAQLIGAQILALNTVAPQAVLLVGGGALTPLLPDALAQALDIPSQRVGIRRPDAIDGLLNIPAALCTPDLVTPLGILKLAGGRALNFVNVTVNDQQHRLFNIGNLTVADALLAAGVDVRTLHGRPGLGLTLNVNGEMKFLPGSLGQPGSIHVNDVPAKFDDKLSDGDIVVVEKGSDGLTPTPRVRDVVTLPQSVSVMLENQRVELGPIITVNCQAVSPDRTLADRDQVVCRLPNTLGEVLTAANMEAEPIVYSYTVNGVERSYSLWPTFSINGEPSKIDTLVKAADTITLSTIEPPTAGNILGVAEGEAEYTTVIFNGSPCHIPLCRYTLHINGKTAILSDKVPDGAVLDYQTASRVQPTVSDVLLVADFKPSVLPGGLVTVMLNGKNAEYITPVRDGDRVDVSIVSS